MHSTQPNQSFGRHGQMLSFLIFLVVCALAGGSSRLDAIQQIFVWWAAILFSAATLFMQSNDRLRDYNRPLAFVALCAALVGLQLVPLPYSIWSNLPGHHVFVQAMSDIGIAQSWHPLNLTPDLGWGALLSLLPIIATVLGFATIGSRGHTTLAVALTVLSIGSALLGLMQIVQGQSSALRLYAVVSVDSAVGLFANRNHNAALLALALPILAVTARLRGRDPKFALALFWAAVAMGLFVLGSLMVVGSRAGLVLGGIGIVSALTLGRHPSVSLAPGRLRSDRRWRRAVGGAFIAIAIAAVLLLSRSTTVSRFWTNDIADDLRVRSLSAVWSMAVVVFPFGTGFGSFSSAYRAFEPLDLLAPAYMNQAHNDFLQLLIEGGAAGIALLAVFAIWWLGAAVRLWRQPQNADPKILLGRLGTVITVMLGGASIVDYPLRTPLLAVIFTIGALWMHAGTLADQPIRGRSRRNALYPAEPDN